MYYSEKRAKEFLAVGGFDILLSDYFQNRDVLKKLSEHFKFPVVMKISGEKIVHKAKIGGVKIGIKNSSEVLRTFDKFKKIKNFESVVIQKQIKGKELFLGIKKTPEFGHVALFGSGGGDVEKVKDISFRVFPLSKKDVFGMLKETKISKKLNEDEIKLISKNLMKLNSLIKRNPSIIELDINPLVLYAGKAQVVDARIVFE